MVAALILAALLVAAPSHAQLRFADRTADSGVGFRHHSGRSSQKYLIETMGGGVALLDFDGDGLLDLLLINGGAINHTDQGPAVSRADPRLFNRLYRNQGDGGFADLTSGSGLEQAPGGRYGMGVAVGDYDNDGRPDVAVTGVGAARLYRNETDSEHPARFRDVSAEAGFNAPGWSASAGFIDYDADGRLDLFVTRYLDWDFSKHIACRDDGPRYCSPLEHEPTTSLLFHNEGGGRFRDVSADSGVGAAAGKALGVAFHDANADGLVDILVANDSEPQQLFMNQGDGSFTEDALLAGVAVNEDGGRYAGMGVVFQDYDNDSRPDIVITNLAKELYALYRNDGGGAFTYVTRTTNLARITARMSGWGVALADFDLDGWSDLFVAQGHVLDTIASIDPALSYLQPPLAARNLEGKFEDVSGGAGPVFGQDFSGRGAAFGDLDNDGDLDVVVNVLDGPPLILENRSPADDARSLALRLIGERSPRDGQGAVVSSQTRNGNRRLRFVTAAGSYLSASDSRVLISIPSGDVLEWVRIQWPSGVEQTITEFPSTRSLQVREAQAP